MCIRDSYTIMWWTAAALGVFAMAMHLLIADGRIEGFGGGRRIAPAAISALLLLAGFGAAINSIPEAAALEIAAPDPSGDGETSDGVQEPREELFTLYCALGPTVAHGR